MNYIDPVKWPEVQEEIRQKMLSQPRGYQAQLAKKMGKTPGYVNQIVLARRQVPFEHLDLILQSVGLELEVRPAPARAEGEK